MGKYDKNHKQSSITVLDSLEIQVDQGLEDIIKTLFSWGFYTSNSCIDNNGSVWIDFDSFYDVDVMMQAVLNHRNGVNEKGYVRQTLWDFLEEKGRFNLVFGEENIPDPQDDNAVIGIGRVEHNVGLRFPKESLSHFQTLLFEVFPEVRSERNTNQGSGNQKDA